MLTRLRHFTSSSVMKRFSNTYIKPGNSHSSQATLVKFKRLRFEHNFKHLGPKFRNQTRTQTRLNVLPQNLPFSCSNSTVFVEKRAHMLTSNAFTLTLFRACQKPNYNFQLNFDNLISISIVSDNLIMLRSDFEGIDCDVFFQILSDFEEIVEPPHLKNITEYRLPPKMNRNANEACGFWVFYYISVLFPCLWEFLVTLRFSGGFC